MGRNTKRRSRGGVIGGPGELKHKIYLLCIRHQLQSVLLMHTTCVDLASKKRKRAEWTDSPFGRSVESAGMALSDGSEPNQLSEWSSFAVQ